MLPDCSMSHGGASQHANQQKSFKQLCRCSSPVMRAVSHGKQTWHNCVWCITPFAFASCWRFDLHRAHLAQVMHALLQQREEPGGKILRKSLNSLLSEFGLGANELKKGACPCPAHGRCVLYFIGLLGLAQPHGEYCPCVVPQQATGCSMVVYPKRRKCTVLLCRPSFGRQLAGFN